MPKIIIQQLHCNNLTAIISLQLLHCNCNCTARMHVLHIYSKVMAQTKRQQHMPERTHVSRSSCNSFSSLWCFASWLIALSGKGTAEANARLSVLQASIAESTVYYTMYKVPGQFLWQQSVPQASELQGLLKTNYTRTMSSDLYSAGSWCTKKDVWALQCVTVNCIIQCAAASVEGGYPK